MITQEIYAALTANQDEAYRSFHARLMPGIDKATILGVRTPVLRTISKDFLRREDLPIFLEALPHAYYEENNLHGIFLSTCSDFDETIRQLDAFLPFVDNWATCDLIRPKCFKHHRERLKIEIGRWLESDAVYTVRFAVEMLMLHFLDDAFDAKDLETVAQIQSTAYYVQMMMAWYFAVALAKQWDSTLPFLMQKKLPVWVHNKTIQKAVESFRITDAQKAYLKTLKIPYPSSKIENFS